MAKWREITTLDEWKDVYATSEQRPVVLFKHSTACPVSAAALEEFDDYLGGQPREDVEYVLVKVIESRPVSNQIAEDLSLKHASPQIMRIEKKEQTWNSSHWSITKKHMTAVLD
ncbi:bacillithiol system redox-active protein YtxJ [Paenibacillus turpanensis]|uniref:bacillithiol system redox-active protein YtxJ n=1 Tax=Paenibacillus turpanensis TaxID=2689078 RepID=UPI001409749F|nr:bacillithiol system redox-active protein YtxJ [Paenibacillus turpanensis]